LDVDVSVIYREGAVYVVSTIRILFGFVIAGMS